MIFESTYTDGPWLIKPEIHQDIRGGFFRYYCEDQFKKNIPGFQPFVQCNQSMNTLAGTLRGLHYQKPPFAEAKLIRCIKGKVWDVCVDIRLNSATFLKVTAIELSEHNQLAIYIPEGFAHGFVSLENNSELIYHHSKPYNASAESGIRFYDPLVNISWPRRPEIISEKDTSYPLLSSDFKGIQL